MSPSRAVSTLPVKFLYKKQENQGCESEAKASCGMMTNSRNFKAMEAASRPKSVR